MLRKCAAAIILAIMLAGCRTAKPPAAAPSPPAPTVADPAPATSEVPLCGNPGTGGPPSFAMTVAGANVSLPFSSCRLIVPAGPLKLYLLVSNLQPEFPVAVTGAPPGLWQDQSFRIDLEVAQGETRPVTIDLSGLGREPVTYTLVGAAPAPALIASAPSRQGPWTDVGGSGLVPADHAWLRISYPLSMAQKPSSALIASRYGTAGTGLPGVWEGDRTQYVDISGIAPVLFVTPMTDANGLPLWWPSPGVLYRGAPPELQSVAPADGSVRSVLRFDTIPGSLTYQNGAVLYFVAELVDGRQERSFRKLDPATGKVSDQVPSTPEPVATGAPERMHFPSPDGKLDAELVWDGMTKYATDDTQHFADLIIRDVASRQVVLQAPQWLSSFRTYGCGKSTPGFGWRPDGQAVAALDEPAMGQLALKLTSLKGETRTVAELKDQGGQFEWDVTWSPSGELVTFQSKLVEAASGRVVAEQLTQRTFWSPDGRYLLLYQADHPWTNWGEIALLELATGARRSLGHGQALGWTPDGKALLIRWDVSRQIPPPAKGCL